MRIHTLLAVALALLSFAVSAAPPAAQVTLLTGQGTATAPGGTIRILAKGADVFARELISSGPSTYLNLKFRDGSFIMLRPNSRMQIEAFAYETPEIPAAQPAAAPAEPAIMPRAQTQQAYFSLLKGGFRAVTGLIGKANKEEYRFNTPIATIGIRGTDYVVILCDIACNNDPVIASSLQAGQQAAGGLVVGTITGGVFVSSSGGTTEVKENQYTMTLPDGTTTQLPYEPRLLRVDPIPNPACGG